MHANPYASSLETRVLSATPMELVRILYQAAIEAVQAARQHLHRGNILERGRSVSQAIAILAELNVSLNHERGGELSTRLAAMYDYLQRTLLDANFRQADDGLEAAEKVLKTLNEAWLPIDLPRSGSSTETRPASDVPSGPQYPLGEYAPTIAQQWCA